MNILIDATWIGGMYGTRVMHGGLRVTNEFLKRLGHFKQHHFFLTNTNYLEQNIVNLEKYNKEVIGSENVSVKARDIKWLGDPRFTKMYSKVSRYVPVPYLYPFIGKDFLEKIQVYHAPADAIPGVIRRNKKVKKFFTALDLIPLVRPDLSNNFYDYTKRLYDSLTPDINVLAISESTKNDLLQYRKDLNADKIRVIYLGADEQLFYSIDNMDVQAPVLQKYGLNGKKYFLTVNSMARYKNVEFILDNYSSFIKDNNIDDMYLVVIGQNREVNYKEYVEKKYNQHGKVIFLDYVEDQELAYLYNAAFGFLYMSLYEGFGLPILEAMQCGTPVICSNTSSMPEVAGDAALLVNPVDSDGFRKALSDVYQNDALRSTMKHKGRLQAGKFSWPKYAEEVIKAFEEM